MSVNRARNINIKTTSSRFFCVLGLAAISCLMIAGPQAFGQETGTFLGTLKDATGATVSGASVSATNEGTSLRRSTTTDSEGKYVIPLVPVGTYRLDVDAKGFKVEIRSGIDLQVAS